VLEGAGEVGEGVGVVRVVQVVEVSGRHFGARVVEVVCVCTCVLLLVGFW
jgi:hypothetical protein